MVLLDRRGGDLLAREADVDLLVGVFGRAGLRPRGVVGLGALRADALVVTIAKQTEANCGNISVLGAMTTVADTLCYVAIGNATKV